MKKGERVFCLVMLGLSVVLLIASLGITPVSELTITSDGAYPTLIACLSLVFAIWMVLENRGRQEKQARQDSPSLFPPDVLVMVVLVAAYALLVPIIHYALATLLFTVLSISYLERWSWRTGLLVGFISTFWIILIFKYFFNVILP